MSGVVFGAGRITYIVGTDGQSTPSLEFPPSYPYRCDCGTFVVDWDDETYDAQMSTRVHDCKSATPSMSDIIMREMLHHAGFKKS